MARNLVLIVLAAALLAACQRETAGDTPAAAGAGPTTTPRVSAPLDPPAVAEEPAYPALAVTTIDGTPYELAASRGKWVVVNFWATWCKPCLKEMPELSALDAMREHVEVVGLAYEDIEAAAMRAFLERHPVAYPVAIIDVYAPPPDFATPRGLPMTYLVDPDGKVARKFLGPVTSGEIEAAIAEAGGPAVPTT
jgi:thiol-disulfide isomerase/thioredoxin